MANINDYFKNTDSENSHTTLRLCNGRYFNEKIKDFYTECIEYELKRIEPYIACQCQQQNVGKRQLKM